MINKMLKEFITSLSAATPERESQKNEFIMSRMDNLAFQNLNQDQLVDTIKQYLEYNTQGVAKSLTFNKNLDSDIKLTAIEIIKENPVKYDFNTDFINLKEAGLVAVYNENIIPKTAILISNNDMRTATSVTFVDKDELDSLCKSECLEQCINNFEEKSSSIIHNVKELTNDNEEAFATLFTRLKPEQLFQLENLTTAFDIQSQLDKELRKPKSNEHIINSCINILDNNDQLKNYVDARVTKHSLLNDSAQQKLLSAQDKYRLSHQENIIEQDPKKHSILSLSKEHETHFTKVESNNSHFHWINKDESVKIYPERVTVPKVTRDSVELALDAAIMNFGKELKIRGTQQFKQQIIELLVDNEKYKDITLLNPDLNKQLDKVRGTPKNTMSEGTIPQQTIENSISSESNQVEVEQSNPTEKIFTINSSTTSTDVMNYFESINPQLIAEAKNSGFITHKQPGFMDDKVLITAEPKELAEVLSKVTGASIEIDSSLTKSNENQRSM